MPDRPGTGTTCHYCGRVIRDDCQQHDGQSPCWVHVDTGLHTCYPDSDGDTLATAQQ